jgi:NAD(P)-dependent dehydrogenase (short-subunit alcohol dehydrogenase family)
MENKVALGTGGLTRIGSRAAASAFVRKGARIILYDNRDEAGRSILDACDGWSRHANSPLEDHHRGLNAMATNTGINRYTILWDEDWP